MNSKRALFMLMINQKKVRDGFKLVDLNTLEKVSIEDCYEIVEKDLELLEILKKHYNINSLTVSLDSFISITINKTDKDFEKIKEWLDEKEKEERMEND